MKVTDYFNLNVGDAIKLKPHSRVPIWLSEFSIYLIEFSHLGIPLIRVDDYGLVDLTYFYGGCSLYDYFEKVR
jgi:hypothetical protein